eukprot:TRINITY_DN1239_c0_g1_i2.p1 TRINITY_DN1239_c0_g1~~TRINITY_DN1239_c0_g1_i2.p1  ORF type:complete len:173 (-),score=42.08 TRINITY_DN1239_c0_g1_i2:420-893(-)
MAPDSMEKSAHGSIDPKANSTALSTDPKANSTQHSSVRAVLAHCLAGATGGLLSGVLFQPLDVIKTLQQRALSSSAKKGPHVQPSASASASPSPSPCPSPSPSPSAAFPSSPSSPSFASSSPSSDAASERPVVIAAPREGRCTQSYTPGSAFTSLPD